MNPGRAAVLVTALLLTSSPTAAAAPGRQVASSRTIMAGGGLCDYPVTLTIGGVTDHRPSEGLGFVTLPASPGERVTTTAVSDPTRSVSVDIGGRFQLVTLPDGSLRALTGGGSYTWSRLGVSAVPATGLTLVDARSRTIDLCDALD